MSQPTGAATLPKGFRYHDESIPKTPESSTPREETRLPSPPRPRLRLKRRQVSQLHAPTQQFLASVAAADVPIPSVEDAEVETRDMDMMDTLPGLHVQDLDDMDIYQHLRPRAFSPPKTPAVELAPSLKSARYPDWSIDSAWSSSDLDSSPEYESSRPSTAYSTQTSSSLFSQYSHASDDGSCISPDLEVSEFPKSSLYGGANTLSKHRPRKAPWTKAMSSHLWATYSLYMSDPRVTPIRLGKSGIPPNGICSRVARQTQRSWKGSKAQSANDPKSRSSTPTAESSKPYMEWPHTAAATRAHLRELCKLRATNQPGRYMSKSPTPFNKTAHRRWNRRSTPARSPSFFSPQDMAMSLILSTSDTMQPEGPLALLTSSLSEPEAETEPFPELALEPEPVMNIAEVNRDSVQARLASPFLAKSYGPSSSSSLAASVSLPRQSSTLGPRKLKSPVRLTRSRSGTQKRRSFKGLEDQPRKRPSLAAAFWREGSRGAESSVQTMSSQQQPNPTSTARARGVTLSSSFQSREADPFVVSGDARPPRLGSPFSGSSHSFPNRLSAPVSFNLTAFRRPFATVQQPAPSSEEVTTPTRPSLSSRLAYLDQRLKELRKPGTDRRRSQSPLS
ncbi:Uu.00g015310.m01.CDS01 [Anthostomella pinea]|uniref:Uu.00g015310.m01.CDS01 n=1 Tax=Anthostomella pinea TaxID=933095 RepID=A0AAI8YN63_9PEZI|nr:Uu.00g015310.m01.CDS01 [Anthostomella pinea]